MVNNALWRNARDLTRVADVSGKERTTDHPRWHGIIRTSTQTVSEEIFFIVGSGWRHRGRTDRRSSVATKRVKEIFYIIRLAAPRSSTPTEPGFRMSCYFEFSSLQSRVVSVWSWLSLGVLDTEVQSRRRSSLAADPGELLQRQTNEGYSEHQQRRIQKKICVGGESRQNQLIDDKGSRSGSSSAEDAGEFLHRQTDEEDSEL